MKIALVGYGKMGHMIAKAAEIRGHEVVCTADLFASDASCVTSDRAILSKAVVDSGAEGIIEFSHPASVLDNITALIPLGLPMVVGTTGWLDSLNTVSEKVHLYKTALLHSANFSIGVNLFYKIISDAARLLASFDEYDVALFEAHHKDKADSPSGTALDIAKRILENTEKKTTLVVEPFDRKPQEHELHLSSLRVGSVPGTHSVFFDSNADTIELTHTARNREGFALGAVHALEWLLAPQCESGKKRLGVFTMSDVFN